MARDRRSVARPHEVWLRHNDDGMGYTLKLDALPVNGEIVLRVPTEKEEPASAPE